MPLTGIQRPKMSCTLNPPDHPPDYRYICPGSVMSERGMTWSFGLVLGAVFTAILLINALAF